MLPLYNNRRHEGYIPQNGYMYGPNGQVIHPDDRRRQNEPPTQWRPTEWSKEYLESLKENLINFKPSEDPNITRTRILMIGPVGAGKSSFYNTIDSIFRNRIRQRASCGSADQSLTKNYTTYTIKDQKGTDINNFCLCDTRGLEEVNGLHEDDCEYLLDGKIRNNYMFSPEHPIRRWDFYYFNSKPSANDMVHCIAFVLDATTVDVLSDKLLRNIRTFQNQAKERGIVQTVVLTKIDKLCNDVQKDISSACTSQVVVEYVQKVADLLGLPRNNVFPVKNYENETELDDKISILALTALKQMIYFTEDCMEKKRKEAESTQWWPCNIL